MSEQRYRASLFQSLKQVLSAQGLRYRDLADRLGTSEATVKRLFHDQDCKLSRLIELCEALGVGFSELAELAASSRTESSVLPVDTEQALAADPGLGAFFMLLVGGLTPEAIGHQNSLTQSDVYRYLRELEKLRLVQLHHSGTVDFKIKRPVRWRLDGPLHQLLVRVNQTFVKEALANHQRTGHPFYSASRLFSEHSIKLLSDEVGKLYERFQQQASLDQMFYPVETLQPLKLLATVAPFDLPRYFEVPPFADRHQGQAGKPSQSGL